MSYDLFFACRQSDQTFLKSDFLHYFQERQFYQCSDCQAAYSNEDTGVYFTFEYHERDAYSQEEEDEDSPYYPVSFNLNYYRPHTFGLEAEPQVAAFVKASNLRVIDPQMNGMGEGDYQRAGFLNGWNAGNEFAFSAILTKENDPRHFSLPAEKIQTYWRWNFHRNALQDRIQDRAFVPRIFFFTYENEIKTGVAWGDGIPILMPFIDLIFVPRKRLAPRHWFRTKEDMVVFKWPEVERVIKEFPQIVGEAIYYEIIYDTTPPQLEQLIRNQKPWQQMPTGLAFDQVLDQELIVKAISRNQ